MFGGNGGEEGVEYRLISVDQTGMVSKNPSYAWDSKTRVHLEGGGGGTNGSNKSQVCSLTAKVGRLAIIWDKPRKLVKLVPTQY